MALQFPTFQPPNLVGGFASGFETGMDLRQRYEAIKQARQQQQAQQEMAKAILSAGQPQIAPEDQQAQPANMLTRALQGIGLSVTPLDTGQPVAQQPMQPTAPISAQQIAAPIMPTTPVQAPKAIAPKQPITPKPTSDTSALTADRMASLGMVKRGSLPAMGDYLEARPSRAGSKPRILVVADKSGNAVLLPTRVNGKNLSDKQARAYYSKTGQNLGTFNNPQAAFDYAYGLANKTLEPVAEPDTVSAPTEASTPATMPADTAAEAVTPAQSTTPTIDTARPTVKSLFDVGRQYGLTDEVMRKHPREALQYIQAKQAQDVTESKAKFDMVNDAIRNIESGKTVRDRAAIASQYAQMGAISPQLAKALTAPTDVAPGTIKTTDIPGDRYHQLVQYEDPNTGEIKSQIVSAQEKDNMNQWIADSQSADPAISGPASEKLAAWDRHNRQTQQTNVTIRTEAAKDMAGYRSGLTAGKQATKQEQQASEAQAIGDAIMAGKQPPDLTGLGRSGLAGEVRAYLARKGFDLRTMTMDYNATKRHMSTLNGPQQLRLRQAVSFTSESLGLVEDLARQWKGGNFPALNKINLKLAEEGLYGQKAQSIATKLDNQIADLQSELATVYKGGNSSTDESLRLASKQLRGYWGEKTLLDNVDLIRKNLALRSQSIAATQVAGTSQTRQPQAPTRQPARPTAQPASGRRVLSASEVKRVKFL